MGKNHDGAFLQSAACNSEAAGCQYSSVLLSVVSGLCLTSKGNPYQAAKPNIPLPVNETVLQHPTQHVCRSCRSVDAQADKTHGFPTRQFPSKMQRCSPGHGAYTVLSTVKNTADLHSLCGHPGSLTDSLPEPPRGIFLPRISWQPGRQRYLHSIILRTYLVMILGAYPLIVSQMPRCCI